MSEASDLSLFNMQTLLDPYPTYQRLRDEHPVFFDEALGAYVVTRYDLLREAIRDTATFSSKYDAFLNTSRQMAFDAAPDEVKTKLKEIEASMVLAPPTMLTLDEPEHTQYRSLVSKLFTGSVVKRAEPSVQAVIDQHADAMAGRTACDFTAAFAFPVPLEIIGDRLGIPKSERGFFDEAATAAAAGLRLSPLTPEVMVERAELQLRLQNLLIDLFEARKTDPQDDMITILAQSELEEAGRPLTHGEMLSILQQFLVAGHETTASTFSWGMLLLCQNPEIQDEIRGDAKLIKTFVEEALRIESPVQGLPRLCTKDTNLGGVDIPAGSMMMLRYGAANRDERQFPGPETVDVRREKAGMQMAFGSGVHHCIGAPLARQELNLGFATLLDRYCNFRLDEAADAPQAEPSFILRNLPYLHVTYEARA